MSRGRNHLQPRFYVRIGVPLRMVFVLIVQCRGQEEFEQQRVPQFEPSLFCLRIAPLTVSNFFDHLWLVFVNRREFSSCVVSCFQ